MEIYMEMLEVLSQFLPIDEVIFKTKSSQNIL